MEAESNQYYPSSADQAYTDALASPEAMRSLKEIDIELWALGELGRLDGRLPGQVSYDELVASLQDASTDMWSDSDRQLLLDKIFDLDN